MAAAVKTAWTSQGSEAADAGLLVYNLHWAHPGGGKKPCRYRYLFAA
jgi:hypothetical protein